MPRIKTLSYLLRRACKSCCHVSLLCVVHFLEIALVNDLVDVEVVIPKIRKGDDVVEGVVGSPPRKY